MNPKVSVIIPARNAEHTLLRSVNSVLRQDYNDLEVIVAVNGCTDSTLELAESIKDGRVKVIQTEAGIVPALNCALKIASGKYIARQDADDEWLPGKIAQQVYALEQGIADVLGTQMIIKDNESLTQTNYPTSHQECLNYLFNGQNPIGHPTVMFNAKILDKVGGYWEFYPFAEDMDLWMRMIPHAKFANLNDKFVIYHHSKNPKYDPAVPRVLAFNYSRIYGVR